MKLEKGKVYKCWHSDGSWCLMFSDGEELFDWHDYTGVSWMTLDFTKVEPYEPESVDTLQEVVDYAMSDPLNKDVNNPKIYIEVGKYGFDPMSKDELLSFIRESKLKEITPEELAKMRYQN